MRKTNGLDLSLGIRVFRHGRAAPISEDLPLSSAANILQHPQSFGDLRGSERCREKQGTLPFSDVDMEHHQT